MNSSTAFDSSASSYDEQFTNTTVAKILRERVHRRLSQHFGHGQLVLELGCGTGEDAMFLAMRNVQVVATDASAAMLDTARHKMNTRFATGQIRSLRANIRFESLNLDHLPDDLSHYFRPQNPPVGLRPFGTAPNPRYDTPAPRTQFDGVFSNFGPLNCINDWRPLASWLAGCIKPGGTAAFGVMSPLCIWEFAWHGLHGEWHVATRRFRLSTTYSGQDGQALSISYPTVTRLQRDFAPWFRRIHLEGVGLVLPPSDVYGVLEKHPKLLKRLSTLDKRLSQIAPLAIFADHYWIEFERY